MFTLIHAIHLSCFYIKFMRQFIFCAQILDSCLKAHLVETWVGSLTLN